MRAVIRIRRGFLRPCLLVTGCLLQLACGHFHVPIASYTRTLPAASPSWRAGAARVEITPMPGYPMGGHSLGGRVSRGRWLPLYARAFYFRDPAGQSLVLVSCDLVAVPAGLQQKVAFLVNRTSPEISRDNLILSATHTHHSPGNYMTSGFYNAFLSQIPGFDPAQFEELASRIAACVTRAIEEAGAPGAIRVTWGSVDIRDLVKSGAVRAFVRNRAVSPFLLNHSDPRDPDRPDACAFLYPPPGPSKACQCGEAPVNCDIASVRRSGYDGRLTVMTATRDTSGSQTEIGKLVFFGVHPTAMSDHSTFYSSDFTGLAMRTLEKESNDADFIAGFFNGAEGDVSPDWGRQDADDVRAIAAEFLKAIRAVPRGVPIASGAGIRVRRITPAQREFCGGSLPLMGVATLGGAEDGRAVTFDLGWRARSRSGLEYKKRSLFARLGLWRLNNPNQGVKQPALDYSSGDLFSLTALVAPPRDYPGEVPLMVARIGDIQLLAVPFEVTTLAGYQIRKSVDSRTTGPTLLIGLANEYLSYVTTEAEYQFQDYEGASTLYGPATVACIARALRKAATLPDPPSATRIPAADFDVGTGPLLGMPLGPAAWGANPDYSDRSIESPFEENAFSPPWPRFEWQADEDSRLEIQASAAGKWMKVTDDDDGFLLLELVGGKTASRKSSFRWNAVWIHRDGADRRSVLFVARSRIEGSDRMRCSAPFTPAGIAAGSEPLPLREADCPIGISKITN